ncbi:hypothetical protein LMG7141_00722 [Ralstonia condita]|uniref:Lipoprotein transmembrane n=1 Tax=Ralstonia condita TaxID=3058600 RepID=A0ABM9J099_9RALS|nr:hypothetical protein [Ralstonia sp. LMG 7141]CAJ0778185.1 hypothetical protein LMG7141_00722 [Ralstonia sp. LMG 7141]
MLRPKLLCLGVVALLAACSNLQTQPTDTSNQTTASTGAAPATQAVQSTPATPPGPTTPPIVFSAPDADGTTTVNLPPKDKMSLSEYRAQTRDRLIKSENARPDVADCAAHASWIIPRSTSFDQFRLPTGALSDGQAKVEPWDTRFSPSKQGAIKVSSVVSFIAAVHKRGTPGDQWEPVKVRCGYDEGMMLAYELLDANGQPFASPSAAPSTTARTHCRRGHRCTTTAAHGKTSARGKASAKSAKASRSNGTAKAKSATTGKSKSNAKSTTNKATKKKSTASQ